MAKTLNDMPLERSVFLFNFFDQDTSEDVIKELMALDQESAEPIYLFINSYGGSVFSLFAILDTISSIKAEVSTVCLGEADSCGAVLLSAGKERFIGQNSRTMIHEVSTVLWGKVSKMAEDLEEAKDVNNKLIKILANNSPLSFEELSDIMKKDTYMDATATIEAGLADFVLDEGGLEKETEEVKNFINSFSGHVRDENMVKVMFNRKGAQTPKRLTNQFKSKIKDLKKEKKGETSMNKEELIAKLKTFDVDVVALQDSVTTLTAEVHTQTLRADKAVQDLADIQASTEEGKIVDLLDALITDKKSTQDANEKVYGPAFRAAGFEAAQAMAAALPIIDIKTERVSDESQEEEELVGDGASNVLDRNIKAYMAKNDIKDYSAAAEAYIAEVERKGNVG